MLAGAFLLIAIVEMGSHAYLDSRDLGGLLDLQICRVSQDSKATVDCPDNQKRRGPESNLMDEMSIHAMILNDLTLPVSGIIYRSAATYRPTVSPLAGIINTPFHPPEQLTSVLS